MGFLDAIRGLFAGGEGGRDMAELCRRLGLSVEELRAIRPQYHVYRIAKRGGGQREIAAPEDGLRAVQRGILRKVLGRLRAHPAVRGFERGHSIVTNAREHCGRAVVVRMDIRDFFPSTTAKRVQAYFLAIGWDRGAARVLTELTTYCGVLPQGAPTSPRLANLVNYALDSSLDTLARKRGGTYTRYADDMVFSFVEDNRQTVHTVVRVTGLVVKKYGYRLHMGRKLRIRRRHQRQEVTGLVVNARTNLPRSTRRLLRAVEHHQRVGRPATLTAEQLNGWRALQSMIRDQAADQASEEPA
ncbi:MAG TPA: reverse transcriptase family protein [Phycisphaerae bacterium]|nr:reverse transcriptase family protein [Phycisphaerae bacterium]